MEVCMYVCVCACTVMDSTNGIETDGRLDSETVAVLKKFYEPHNQVGKTRSCIDLNVILTLNVLTLTFIISSCVCIRTMH